jgi:hypothetical protein
VNGHDVSHLQIAVPLLGALGGEEYDMAIRQLCKATENKRCVCQSTALSTFMFTFNRFVIIIIINTGTNMYQNQ